MKSFNLQVKFILLIAFVFMSIAFGVYFHHVGTKQSNATIRHLQLNYGQAIQINEEFERITGLLPLAGKPFLRHKIREIKDTFIKQMDEIIETSQGVEADLLLSIKLDILDYLTKLAELSDKMESSGVGVLGKAFGSPVALQALASKQRKRIHYLVNARLGILKKLRNFTNSRKDFFKGSILHNKKIVKNQFLRNMIVSSICLLIVIGLSLSIFKRVIRPLIGFKKFSDNLGKGAIDAQWKLPVSGNDEIVALAKSLLKMRKSLKSMVVRNLYFNKLVTNSPGLVIITKTKEGIQAINNAALESLGYTMGQMLNKGSDLLFEGTPDAEPDESFDDLVKLCKDGPIDKNIYTKDGWPIPFLINVTDIDVLHEGTQTVLITGQDVRNLRDLETGIRLQMAELDDREVETKELKTRLEKKSTELATLYEKSIFPHQIEEKKYNFEQVDQALLEMTQDYTQKFLEIEQLASGLGKDGEQITAISRAGFEKIQDIILLRNTMEGEIHPHVELNQILEENIDHLSNFSNKTIIYHGVLAPDLWVVDGNSEELKRVFNCIIHNAEDASSEGGKILIKSQNIHLHLGDVENLENGDYLKVSIEDYGKGILAKNMELLFTHFFSTKEKGKENLFGLSMAKKIIEEHHGIILVKSKPGKGTAFSIYLPRGGDPEKELTEEEESLILEISTHPESVSL